MRALGSRLLNYFGVGRAFRVFHQRRSQIPIIVFHRISDQYDPFTQPIHPSQFEEFLVKLLKCYAPQSLEEMGKVVKKNACFITFDDATSDFFEFAYPILKEKGIPTTLFVPAASVDEGKRIWNNELFHFLVNGTNHDYVQPVPESNVELKIGSSLHDVLQLIAFLNNSPALVPQMMEVLRKGFRPGESDMAVPMTWEQIREVSNNGVTVGNHGLNHFSFSEMTTDQAKSEISVSQRILSKKIGYTPKAFAYPMGEIGHQDLVQDAFELAFSTVPVHWNLGKKEPSYPRISVYEQTSDEMHLRVAGFHRFITSLI